MPLVIVDRGGPPAPPLEMPLGAPRWRGELAGLGALIVGFALLGLIPFFADALAEVLTPLQQSTLRLCLAAVFLAPFAAILAVRNGRKPMRILMRSAASGVVIAGATATYQLALASVDVSIAITVVIIAMLSVAAALDSQRPPLPQLALVAIALILAVYALTPSDGVGLARPGIAWAALCGVIFGFLPFSLRSTDAIPTVMLNTVQFASGGVVLLIVDGVLAVTLGGRFAPCAFLELPPEAWTTIAVAAVVTVALAYWLIALGRRVAKASDVQVAIASTFEPVVAVVIAVLFLGQPGSAGVWLAVAAVSAINLVWPLLDGGERRRG